MDNQTPTPLVKSGTAPVMHAFTQTQTETTIAPMKVIMILLVLTLVGVGTGFALSKYNASTGKEILPVPQVGSSLKGKTFGDGDTKIFKDTAEGMLKEGGIEGEGQYHLVRPGGDSQNVYLTSSLVDLSEFKGKKIKVWGETQKAQTAGWLMDVGKVEVQ